MPTPIRIALVFVLGLLIPTATFAQATIAGSVRDTSGAVLPGVTVEASSPALIEKVRIAVTDGTGEYRIVDLRPGLYTVTFTLPGFNVAKREGIELVGTFTATVDGELRVGALEETITVTGAAPIVDVQSATRQTSMTADVISAIPSGRNYMTLGVLIPGVSLSAGPSSVTQDVGGSTGPLFAGLVAHGSHEDGARILYNGISTSTLVGSANRSVSTPNTAAYQELTIDVSGVDALTGQGGVRVNLIPRDGGNRFTATNFMSYANEDLQGNNFSEELRARGLRTPNRIRSNWDVNPGVGGPIVRDRLWFYAAARDQRANNYVAGLFENANLGNPAVWTYAPDTSRPGISKLRFVDVQGRVTWQLTQRDKLATSINYQNRLGLTVGPTTSPEAQNETDQPSWLSTAEWSSTLTNKLLLQVIGMYHPEKQAWLTPSIDPALVQVQEQAGLIPGLTYRNLASYSSTYNWAGYYRVTATYVTGAHAFKAGYNDGFGSYRTGQFSTIPYSYRLNNGVPNQITLRTTPLPGGVPQDVTSNMDHDGGLFVQDRWTRGRLTLSGALRYDFYTNSFPEQRIGPAPLAPNRNIAFPAMDNLNWKDITPRSSVVYDLFGTGKTAVRASLNKYVAGLGLGTITTANNPAAQLVTQTTRNWTDANRNYVPECDLLNPAANGECAALANRAFGGTAPGAAFDPELLSGWGKRGYDWEFSVGAQHQLGPRVSMDVAYFRRWYGNFYVMDDLAFAPSDYDRLSITAPVDPRLPDGGGYAVTGVYDLKPEAFGRPSNLFVTTADKYGKQIEQWNGVDLSLNARLQQGILLQGGVSTGRTTTDNCEIVAKIPEIGHFVPSGFTANSVFNPTASWLPAQFCHVQTPFLTQVKMIGSYTVPRVDVRVSAAYQNVPGPRIFGNFVATNAAVAPSLGRPLSGNAANITMDIIPPGTLYGDRVNQLDLRFGKILRFGGTTNTVSFDIYNALNSNSVLGEQTNYSAFRVPTAIMVARFAKISWQFDF